MSNTGKQNASRGITYLCKAANKFVNNPHDFKDLADACLVAKKVTEIPHHPRWDSLNVNTVTGDSVRIAPPALAYAQLYPSFGSDRCTFTMISSDRGIQTVFPVDSADIPHLKRTYGWPSATLQAVNGDTYLFMCTFADISVQLVLEIQDGEYRAFTKA